MIHARKRSRFAPQALPSIAAFVRLANGLNCDCSFQAFIPAFVDNAHATFTDFAADTIVADRFEHAHHRNPSANVITSAHLLKLSRRREARTRFEEVSEKNSRDLNALSGN